MGLNVKKFYKCAVSASLWMLCFPGNVPAHSPGLCPLHTVQSRDAVSKKREGGEGMKQIHRMIEWFVLEGTFKTI